MNAIRKFLSSKSGMLSIKLPEAYRSKRLEVIIIPVEEEADLLEDSNKRKEAYESIDLGGSEDFRNTINELIENSKDRELPFRNAN